MRCISATMAHHLCYRPIPPCGLLEVPHLLRRQVASSTPQPHGLIPTPAVEFNSHGLNIGDNSRGLHQPMAEFSFDRCVNEISSN